MRSRVVNWRRGSISEFESNWSIGQKYCFLNQVSVREFSKLVQFETSAERWGTHYSDVFAKRLAILLGEPLSRVNFSLETRFVIPAFRVRQTHEALHAGALRFCPDCIALGFHSWVHQLPWLDRCLIHTAQLRTTCTHCETTLALNGSNATRSGRQAVAGYRCTHCGEPLWQGIDSTEWVAAFSRTQLRPIQRYIQWLKLAEQWEGFAFICNSGQLLEAEGNALNQAAWIVRCVRSVVVPLRSIERCFHNAPCVPERYELGLHSTESDILIQAIEHAGLYATLIGYIRWQCLKYDLVDWSDRVEAIRTRLTAMDQTFRRRVAIEAKQLGWSQGVVESVLDEAEAADVYGHIWTYPATVCFRTRDDTWMAQDTAMKFISAGLMSLPTVMGYEPRSCRKSALAAWGKCEIGDELREALEFLLRIEIKRSAKWCALRYFVESRAALYPFANSHWFARQHLVTFLSKGSHKVQILSWTRDPCTLSDRRGRVFELDDQRFLAARNAALLVTARSRRDRYEDDDDSFLRGDEMNIDGCVPLGALVARE